MQFKLDSFPKFSYRSFPIALLILCLIAFGLLIPSLGFYMDDWHHIYSAYSRGLTGLWEMFLYDGRPFAAIIYSIGFSLLGYQSINWHIFSLILRFLTVLLVWDTCKEIWPNNKREVTWVALLFAVYPLFKLQPVAVAYNLYWTGCLLFTVSIWAMVRSISRTRHFWIYLVLSLITGVMHLVLIKYYSGIELIRPFLIWLLIDKNEGTSKQHVIKVFKYWLPYVLLFCSFFVFRVFLFPLPESGFSRSTPGVIFDLLKSPAASSVQFIESVLKDSTATLFTSWINALNPEIFEITQSASVKTLIITISTGILLYAYLLTINQEGSTNEKGKWNKEAFILGIVLVILGALSGWTTYQEITTSKPLWSDRLDFAFMLGASLLIVAVLETLIGNIKHRTMVFCILITLAISWHLLNANQFRWSWDKQTKFFQQLSWRAPYIEPNTTILSDGELFMQMTEPSTSFALSTLYPNLGQSLELDYFFFSLYSRFNFQREDLIKGMPLSYSQSFIQYNGDSLDSLVISFEPEKNQCLWVLRPEDHEIRVLPEITRDIAVISNLSRIKIDLPFDSRMNTDIFGEEDKETWCYYFQKGDLARQFEDWEMVTNLWDEAAKKKFKPANGVEYIPFIQGFAQLGDWETAEEMTIKANRITHMMSPILCSAWNQIIEDSDDVSEAGENTFERVIDRLECP